MVEGLSISIVDYNSPVGEEHLLTGGQGQRRYMIFTLATICETQK